MLLRVSDLTRFHWSIFVIQIFSVMSLMMARNNSLYFQRSRTAVQ
jgi:hypothetical protein